MVSPKTGHTDWHMPHFMQAASLVVKRHEGVGEKGQLIHDLNSNQLAGVEQALRVDGLAQAARVPDGAA